MKKAFMGRFVFSFAEAESSLTSPASIEYDVHGVEFGIRSPGMFGTN